MKKWMGIILAMCLLASFAGCGQTAQTPGETGKRPEKVPETTVTEAPIILPASSMELMTQVWFSYEAAQRFDAIGGSMANMVNGMPGIYMYANAQELTNTFWIPLEQTDKILETTSLMHGLNRNTFTGAAFRLAPDTDAAAFALAWAENVQNADWVCGFPERLLAVSLEDSYVVCVFGTEELVKVFGEKLAEAYPYAQVEYEAYLMQS